MPDEPILPGRLALRARLAQCFLQANLRIGVQQARKPARIVRPPHASRGVTNLGTGLWGIERAIRRTRRSTLNRIAAALVELQPDLGHADDLASHLASLAGTGLAPESRYAARVEKRRKARWKRVERHVLYRYLVPLWHAQLDAELREERRAARESARLMRG